MADNTFPIRPGMDVFNADQSRYIGTVIHVVRDGTGKPHGAGPVETGTSSQAVEGNPELVHEEGHTVSPTRHVAKRQLGEEDGPVPTIALGNTGPVNQSASHHYATEPDEEAQGVRYFAVRPGRINLGILSPSLWVPADAIRSISMERIVVSVEGDRLPKEWRRKP